MAGCRCPVLLAFVLVCVSRLDAACTEVTFAKFEACTYTFYKDLDSIMASGSKTNLTEFCDTGSKKHLDCVNTVAAECRNAGGFFRRLWDNIINVNGVTNTLNVTCQENVVAVILSNQECIEKTQPNVAICIGIQYIAYQGQLTYLQSQIAYHGTEWYEEELYKAVCHYVESIRDCEKPFGEDCGNDTAKLYDDRSDVARPPICAALTPTMNVLTFGFLSLVACFKGEI